MSILFVLIPLGLVLLGIAIWGFIWAVNSDQFEDLDRAAHSILFDEDPIAGAALDRVAAAPNRAAHAPDRIADKPNRVADTPDRMADAPNRTLDTPNRALDATQ
jgi:cbb3-type cytochrome oxidase maturation protein